MVDGGIYTVRLDCFFYPHLSLLVGHTSKLCVWRLATVSSTSGNQSIDNVLIVELGAQSDEHITPTRGITGRDSTLGAEIHISFRQPFAPSWFLVLAPIKSDSLGWAVC